MTAVIWYCGFKNAK